MDQWTSWSYFPSNLYLLDKPEYLKLATSISNEYLSKNSQKINAMYPAIMSENMFRDPRLEEFCAYIGKTARNILTDQGYDMDSYLVYFRELWAQEHMKYSNQEEHVHGNSCQISGIYVLNKFEGSPKLLIHDPRPAKKYADLLENNVNALTVASQAVNFSPEPGTFVFFNSWLPHSFTRNESTQSFKFIHFNLAVQQVEKVKTGPTII